MWTIWRWSSLVACSTTRPPKRLEITFVGTPPVRQIERASGVSHVEVGGHTLRCFVSGSFQPLLEAVRGYEVISLRAIPAVEAIEAELPHRLTDERKDDP